MPAKRPPKVLRLLAAFMLLVAATVANGAVGCALGLCHSECEMHAAAKVQSMAGGCCEERQPTELPPCECGIDAGHPADAVAPQTALMLSWSWTAISADGFLPLPEAPVGPQSAPAERIDGAHPSGPPGTHSSRAPPCLL